MVSAAAAKRKITLAEELTEIRDNSGRSRAEMARLSGVAENFIAFFEGEAPKGVAADIYARNRLRDYCKFLGLDAEKTTNRYRLEREVRRVIASPAGARSNRRHPLTAVPSSRLLVTPKIIKAALMLLAAAGLGAYFIFAAQQMMSPPQVVVSSPEDGLVTHDKTLVVEGHTEREVGLLINGKPVNIDSEGNFNDRLDLHDGLNVIEVVATKKHGKETKVTRRIIVEPRERPTAVLERTMDVQ